MHKYNIIRLLCVLLIVSFLLVGCSRPIDKNSETSIWDKKLDWDNTAYRFIISASPLEGIVANMTDLVKATYIGSQKTYPYYLHIFSVKKVLRGTTTEENIVVRSRPCEVVCEFDSTLNHSTYDIKYKENTDYLLLLKKYSDDEIFEFTEDSLVLPYHSDSKIYINSCQMYEQQLRKFISDEVKQALKEKDLENILLEMTKDNPYYIE